MKSKRLIYLGYYFKETNWHHFKKYMRYVTDHTGRSISTLWKDIIQSSVKYNISLTEYFNFKFYNLNAEERKTFAGTGYMYEYQRLMNPVSKRSVLLNKPLFYHEYASFINHEYISLAELKSGGLQIDNIRVNSSNKLVLKNSEGQCGLGIKVVDAGDINTDSLIKSMEKTGNDMAEGFVRQHDRLEALSPSGLNTVRIMTQLDKNNNVDILGCRLRISVNSAVDNLAAGNIAAPIDLDTGIIYGPGVYSDITKDDVQKHPVTGTAIIGFQLPYWDETLRMVKKAALINTDNRSIGWDVAITNNGPELIEGNHDWCKLLWQLPVKKGLKSILESYRESYSYF